MKRKGLSTIVGAVFFVIVMASTISYVAYSMDLIDNLARSVDIKQDENLNRQNEEFDVLGVAITGDNKFNVTLHNSGNIPIKITRLYVENTTTPTWNASRFDINTEIAPGEIKSNISYNQPLNFVDSQSYLFNFVTERGNNEKFSINSGGNQFIHTNLYALPDAVPIGFNTVLLYEVVNNSTGQLVNIVPSVNITKICSGCPEPTANGNWQPPSYPILKSGEVATFQRSYTINGENNDIFLFNASIQNAYPGVWDEERVDLVQVAEASEAGVSITAQGIGAAGSDPTSLVLHEETTSPPAGAYQWSTTSSDGGNNGALIELNSPISLSWFTHNSTKPIVIDAGNWIAALQYKSNAMPDSLVSNPADLIFHFEGDDWPTSVFNSQGSGSRDLRTGTNCNAPSHPTVGQHSSLTYDIDNDNTECFESIAIVDDADENTIGNPPDSTALWFKTTSTVTGSDQYLINFEESGNNSEYYRIFLNTSGKIVFEWKSKHPSDLLTCTTGTSYDDQLWHHVAVTRWKNGNDYHCQVFMDMHNTVNEFIWQNMTNANQSIDADGTRWTVGTNRDQNANFFDGKIDALMHWDNHQLTLSEVQDLAQTSYGIDAHKLGFAIVKTKQDGSPHQAAPYPYATTFIPFHDSKGGGDNIDSAYGNYNYTMSLNSVTLDSTVPHRLNFTIGFENDNSTWRNLGFDLKIDDEDMTPFASYVQLPSEPSNPIPGYLNFSQNSQMEFFFENGGDRGFRFTFGGTRIVFNATDGSGSYGAIPCVVGASDFNCSNGTAALTSDQDSIWIPPGLETYVKFWRATSIPSHSPEKGVVIPVGTYKGSVWVFGYDDEGLSFEKTFDLGIVTIT